MTLRTLGLLLLTVGCGGGVDNHPTTPDAPADAELDAPDAPSVPLTAHHYVIDRHLIPQTNTEARTLGLDLNGDQTVDNQLGMIVATLAQQGFESQIAVTRSVDRGEILTLVDFGANGFTNSGEASFTLLQGENPNPAPCANANDQVCRHHFNGSATFDAAQTPRDTPLAGALAGGTFTSEASETGTLHIELSLSSAPIAFELLAARAKVVTPSVGEIANGVIAGAIRSTDIDQKLIPAWALSFDAIVTACGGGGPPNCGCAQGSTGRAVVGLFDSNTDCDITADELRQNSLIQSLLAPDLQVNGQGALSVGIGFTAKQAVFTP